MRCARAVAAVPLAFTLAACGKDVKCGPGTERQGNECLPVALFDLRAAVSSIPADGFSKVPVLAIGRNADGTPSTAQVALSVSRLGSGTFSPAVFQLGPLGTTSQFVPCSDASAGCAGPTEIRLSLASNPSNVLATLPMTLAAPTGVGTPAPCLVGGDVMFFDGSGFIFNGTETVTVGSFTAPVQSADDVAFTITPSNPGQGSIWNLEFTSVQLGQPLAIQVYDDAQRAPFASPGHPGIQIFGDGRACNTIAGRFQLHDLVFASGVLRRFTATFEQFCEQDPANVLRGCVHFEQ